MAKRSKAYRAAAEKIDGDRLYTPAEAVRLAKETATTKYDSTVEVALRPAAHDDHPVPVVLCRTVCGPVVAPPDSRPP